MHKFHDVDNSLYNIIDAVKHAPASTELLSFCRALEKL